MTSIRGAIEQVTGFLAEHPEEALETDAAASAAPEEGLRIRVRGPNGEVVTDMATMVGGGGTAPSPGWMLRAALASCDASVIAMEAARAGIELTELTVTVDSDSDNRGLLGLDGSVPPGPLAVRVRIELAASNAGAERLRELVERAETRSPVRDALTREVSMTTEIVA
jgi:uncharacterized OsmC-like protein